MAVINQLPHSTGGGGGGGGGAPTASGEFTHTASRMTIEIGFRPRYLTVMLASNADAISTYNADISETQARYSGASTGTKVYTMASDSTNYRLHGITDTGFIINKRASGTGPGWYFAIGYDTD